MSRRHYYKHKHKEEDVDVTPLLNVLVVLVAFLILSAVFSRITIQEIALPTQAEDGAASDKPPSVTIEVIVRQGSLEIGDGRNITMTIPKLGEKYDIPKLSDVLLRLKEKNSEKQDAAILIEPDIAYETMIQVMDAVKIAEVKKDGGKIHKIILFPQVSIGEAP